MIHCQLIASSLVSIPANLSSKFLYKARDGPQAIGTTNNRRGPPAKEIPKIRTGKSWFCWILPRSPYDLEQEVPSGLSVFSGVWTQGARKARIPPKSYCLTHLRFPPRLGTGSGWAAGRKQQPTDSSVPKLCFPAKKFPEREKVWKQAWRGDSRLQSGTRKSEEACCELRASLGYTVSSR